MFRPIERLFGVEGFVARYFDAINAMDVDAWLATFTDDIVAENPVGTPALHGRDELERFIRGLWAAFDDLEMRPDHVVVRGGTTAVKWSGWGLGRSGRRVGLEGIHLFETDADGLIKRVQGFWDPDAVIGALDGTLRTA